MKRTAIKRKTPLKAKTGWKKTIDKVQALRRIMQDDIRRQRAKTGFKRPATGHRKPAKRRKKSDLQKLKAQLWTLCREITRARYGNTCYTCGKTGLEGSNWQTGHFISSSICSTALRYDLRNLRPQCYNCNINKSGNWLAYELRLTAEHGPDYVSYLKAENEATKNKQYDSLWYEAKISEYQSL